MLAESLTPEKDIQQLIVDKFSKHFPNMEFYTRDPHILGILRPYYDIRSVGNKPVIFAKVWDNDGQTIKGDIRIGEEILEFKTADEIDGIIRELAARNGITIPATQAAAVEEVVPEQSPAITEPAPAAPVAEPPAPELSPEPIAPTPTADATAHLTPEQVQQNIIDQFTIRARDLGLTNARLTGNKYGTEYHFSGISKSGSPANISFVRAKENNGITTYTILTNSLKEGEGQKNYGRVFVTQDGNLYDPPPAVRKQPSPAFANFDGTIEELLNKAAAAAGVDPEFFKTKIQFESSLNPLNVSDSGCVGLGQFEQETFDWVVKELALEESYSGVTWKRENPIANVIASAHYTSYIQKGMFGEKTSYTAEENIATYLAYNIGPDGAKTYLAQDPNSKINPELNGLSGVKTNQGIYQNKDGSYKTYRGGLETIKELFAAKKVELDQNPNLQKKLSELQSPPAATASASEPVAIAKPVSVDDTPKAAFEKYLREHGIEVTTIPKEAKLELQKNGFNAKVYHYSGKANGETVQYTFHEGTKRDKTFNIFCKAENSEILDHSGVITPKSDGSYSVDTKPVTSQIATQTEGITLDDLPKIRRIKLEASTTKVSKGLQVDSEGYKILLKRDESSTQWLETGKIIITKDDKILGEFAYKSGGHGKGSSPDLSKYEFASSEIKPFYYNKNGVLTEQLGLRISDSCYKGTGRGGILIHCDFGNNGTLGCFGIHPDQWENFMTVWNNIPKNQRPDFMKAVPTNTASVINEQPNIHAQLSDAVMEQVHAVITNSTQTENSIVYATNLQRLQSAASPSFPA